MTNDRNLARETLPIPDLPYEGLVTYEAYVLASYGRRRQRWRAHGAVNG
jgi:hypothetical protein